MKLLLFTASSPEIRRIRRARFLNFQQITMPYLGALTPPPWQVTHVDEEAEPVDFLHATATKRQPGLSDECTPR